SSRGLRRSTSRRQWSDPSRTPPARFGDSKRQSAPLQADRLLRGISVHRKLARRAWKNTFLRRILNAKSAPRTRRVRAARQSGSALPETRWFLRMPVPALSAFHTVGTRTFPSLLVDRPERSSCRLGRRDTGDLGRRREASGASPRESE